MTLHARISFSSMARTVQCPGSVVMCERATPLPDSDEHKEGTAAHWLCDLYVKGRNVPEGSPAPNGERVTREMIDAAILWRDTVGFGGMSETPTQAIRIHPTDCWGTPDWRKWDPAALRLTVADFKFGHKFVEVWENWQLLAATCAMLDEIGATGLDETAISVELIVVQPRSYHREGPVRRKTYQAVELRSYFNIMFNSTHEALGPDPSLHTGPECTYCPARHECPQLQAESMALVEYSEIAEPHTLTPTALGRELTVVEDAIKTLEARRTGLAAQAEALIARGERVAGYALEAKQGNLRWLGTTDEVIAFGASLGVDLRKPPEVITPTQSVSRKLLDAPIRDAYSERPTSLKLARITSLDLTKALAP